MARPVRSGLDGPAWRRIEPELVPIDELVPMQSTREHWVDDKVRDPHSSHTGDPFPNVIALLGRLYIEDGHHRIAAAHRRGALRVWARVYRKS